MLDHIGNACEHTKIYPVFLSLGYNSTQFLHDNSTCKCNIKEITDIEKYYKFLWMYRVDAIRNYIGKFIAIKAEHNISFDYSESLERLQILDTRLFKVLTGFWVAWTGYDIDKEDGIDISYRQIATEFVDNMSVWVGDKKLI